MTRTVTIIGSYLSPYVRKVLAALHLKGIAYRIDPVAGFMGNDRFIEISPLRRIPVLMDDQVTLCDSSVICQYLEDRYPQPSLFPADPADRARARWLEEYADTRLADVVIWQLFNQRVIQPHMWGRPADEAMVQKAIEVEIPQCLDYLELQAPASGYFFGGLSLADLSVAALFRNAGFAGYAVDAARWPRVAALVQKTLAEDCLQRLRPFEDKMARTPLQQHRAALEKIGAPLTAETYATDRPRPGIMRI